MISRVERVIAGASISAARDAGEMPLDLLVCRARLGEADIVCAVWLATRRANRTPPVDGHYEAWRASISEVLGCCR
jgi:hypothetical protein